MGNGGELVMRSEAGCQALAATAICGECCTASWMVERYRDDDGDAAGSWNRIS